MRRFAAKGGWWVVGQVVVSAAVVALVVVAGQDWGPVARITGSALMAAGAVMVGLGLVTLGENLTPFPAPRSEGALVERGIYRLVRHPIYGGFCSGAAGLGWYDGNLLAITAAVALAVFLWAKAGHEEARLLTHFPDYAAYRSRVRSRLIPWIV